MIRFKNKFSALLMIGVGAFSLASCQRDPDHRAWEFAPNMYRSVAYEPLKEYEDDRNKYNQDSINMRLPVKGTIVRTRFQNAYAKGPTTDLMIYDIPKDSIEVAERTLTNPIPLNDTTLAEGKVLYTNVCSPCHGENGKGDGLVGKMYKGVPNYSSDAYKNMNDGHIFHTITYGRNRMWPHGSQVSPEERWKIVHYVHQLQKQ